MQGGKQCKGLRASSSLLCRRMRPLYVCASVVACSSAAVWIGGAHLGMGSAGGHGRAAGLPRRRRRQGSRPPKVHRSPRCLQPETPVGSRHAPEFLDETVEG